MVTPSYRYPGVKPFSQKDSHLFFGRSKDIQQLVRYLRTEDLVVLHGKSGLGKTSLIQAGVIPILNASSKRSLPFKPITLRFNSYNPRAPKHLSHIIDANLERESTFLDSMQVKYVSLWHALKSRQLSEGAPKNSPQYLLIFDQFEELFTYPEEEVETFGHDLADLVNGVVPTEFRKVLRRENIINPELKTALAQPGIKDWLHSPVDVKILIAIRSDKFNLLDKLSPYIPNILLNSRILEALNRDQAEEAISAPASMQGEFESPTFRYGNAAREKILDFLTSHSNGRVEGFQLQILCRNIEEKLIETTQTGKPVKSLSVREIADEAVRFEVEDIDTHFADILRTYYEEQLEKLETTEEIRISRSFIEDELIAEGRRVSLDRAVIKAEISDDLLYKLVNTRLIRREPNSLGGFSFEISHDTLLDPIMESRQERRIKEEAEKEREKARLAAFQRQQELEEERELREKELARARAENAELEEQRAKQQAALERRSKYFILTLLVLVVIIAGITALGLFQANKANKDLEGKTRELTLARDSLNRRAQGLSMDLNLAVNDADSVRAIIESLPPEQQELATSIGKMQSLRSRFSDSLGSYEGLPRGIAILERGRLIIRLHLFKGSEFRLDPDLESDATRIAFFKRMLAILQSEKDFNVQVEIHTDKFGTVGGNLKNSMARAYSLTEPLFEVFGEDEDASRVSIVAKGESQQINGSRDDNRRVDLVVTPRVMLGLEEGG